jgi:Rod binding domain-containing protein
MDDMLNINTDLTSQTMLSDKLTALGKYKDIAAVKKNMTAEEKKDAEKAARGFESMFVNMMLKEMKEGLNDDSEKDDEGLGADTLFSYADMQFSDQISKNGTGIGVASMLYKNLTGEDLPEQRVIMPARENNLLRDPISNNINNKIKEVFGSSFEDRVQKRLSNYDGIINEASAKYNVPENIIKAIITAESAGKSDAKSSAGAKGLMQLMDGTAKSLKVDNSFDPYQNIMGGTKYIRQMMDKFNGNLQYALAAYNAGPGNVEKYNGIPPFKETRTYVDKVMKYSEMYKNS